MNVSPRTDNLEVKGHFTIYQKSFEKYPLFRFIFLLNLSFSHLTQLSCTYCNTCYFHSHVSHGSEFCNLPSRTYLLHCYFKKGTVFPVLSENVCH